MHFFEREKVVNVDRSSGRDTYIFSPLLKNILLLRGQTKNKTKQNKVKATVIFAALFAMCVCLRGNSLCVSNNKSKRAAATTDIGLLTTTCVINPGGLFGYPPLPANSEKEQYAARRDIQIPRRGGEAVKFIAFLFLKFSGAAEEEISGTGARLSQNWKKLKGPWKFCFQLSSPYVVFFLKMKEGKGGGPIKTRFADAIAPTYCYLTSVCLRHVYTMCFEFILQKIRNTCLFCHPLLFLREFKHRAARAICPPSPLLPPFRI